MVKDARMLVAIPTLVIKAAAAFRVKFSNALARPGSLGNFANYPVQKVFISFIFIFIVDAINVSDYQHKVDTIRSRCVSSPKTLPDTKLQRVIHVIKKRVKRLNSTS